MEYLRRLHDFNDGLVKNINPRFGASFFPNSITQQYAWCFSRNGTDLHFLKFRMVFGGVAGIVVGGAVGALIGAFGAAIAGNNDKPTPAKGALMFGTLLGAAGGILFATAAIHPLALPTLMFGYQIYKCLH